MTDRIESVLRLGPPIGRGHFSSVLHAEHPLHGHVAAKIPERLPTETPKKWEARRNALYDEGLRLREAEHERIVRVFDVVFHGGLDRLILLLEHCPDGSLEDLYDAGPIPVHRVRDFATDAAIGLSCLHSRDLLHRDIKPGNLLIGTDGRVKLSDFGLVTDEIVAGYASAAGYCDHLAPEVFDRGVTSVATDIWALGMTIYRLLHGSAFYDEHLDGRIDPTVGGFATKLPWLPHIPSPWRSFVRRCMRDEATDRFETARAVSTALAKLPINPSWECDYTPDRVRWSREHKNRRIEAHRIIHSPRRHEWYVQSHPLGVGRIITRQKSDGVISKSEADRMAKDFFS